MKIGVLIIIKKSQIARFTTNMFEGVLNDLALEKTRLDLIYAFSRITAV